MLELIETFTNEQGRKMAKIKCFCGSVFSRRNSHYASGKIKDCGCSKRLGYSSDHPLYQVYKNACRTAKRENVAVEWDSYEQFYEWGITKWEKDLCMTRIDEYGNYSKDNCRFITREEHSKKDRRSENKHPSHGHPFYRKWRNMNSISEADCLFANYDEFFEWMLENNPEGKRISRIDDSIPWDKDNIKISQEQNE